MMAELEAKWRVRLEKHLGRLVTESEWQMAKRQIYIRIRADFEMGVFD